MDLKLGVKSIPVSDVDAAKAFYTEKVGFNLDHDATKRGDAGRADTPPGSACSVVIGEGLPPATLARSRASSLLSRTSTPSARRWLAAASPSATSTTAWARGRARLTILLRGPGRQRVGPYKS